MWDLKGWYRQFHVPPTTWATHQRVWAQKEGPSVVVDQAMMFGDRPASSTDTELLRCGGCQQLPLVSRTEEHIHQTAFLTTPQHHLHQSPHAP